MNQFVILEGPDATGKSSLAKWLAVNLDGMYVHMTGGIGNQPRYHWSTLDWIEWNLQNTKHAIILDRCWISDMICGPYTNPNEQGTFPYREHDRRIARLGGIYVLCDSVNVFERHDAEQDPDHPYDRAVFEKIVQGYRDFTKDAKHRINFVPYSIEEHGHDYKAWVENYL